LCAPHEAAMTALPWQRRVRELMQFIRYSVSNYHY